MNEDVGTLISLDDDGSNNGQRKLDVSTWWEYEKWWHTTQTCPGITKAHSSTKLEFMIHFEASNEQSTCIKEAQ